jgi:hypothetical protein
VAIQSLVDVPDRVDLRVLAGRPFSVLFPVQLDGAPVAFASLYDARAQVRADIGSELVVFTFSTEDGTAVLVNSGGNAAVRLLADAEQTSEWQELWPGSAPETVMWWDLEITDSGLEHHQITSPGTITLVHQVTRDPSLPAP